MTTGTDVTLEDVTMGPSILAKPYVAVFNFHGVLIGIEAINRNLYNGKRTRGSYGEVPGTVGGDGDPVDVLVGPDLESTRVFVVQQRIPPEQFDEHVGDTSGNGGPPQYDEDKVVLGAAGAMDARDLYLDYYAGSGREVGGIIEMSVEEFRERVYAGERQEMPIFKSTTPPGSGWQAIPGGKHNGYRRPKGRGWEYWYPDQHEATHHPDWEPDPTRGIGLNGVKPGDFIAVHGKTGVFRWSPEHADAAGGTTSEGMTWATSIETGEHVMVPENRIQAMRGYDPKAREREQRAKTGGERPKPPRPPKPDGDEGPRLPKPPKPVGGDNRPRGGDEIVGPDTPRAPKFEGSQEKPGTIAWNIENGEYPLLRYQDRTGRQRLGVYVPKQDQTPFAKEMSPLAASAARAALRKFGIRANDPKNAGAVEEVVSNAKIGMVMALRTYRGHVPWKMHAFRYMMSYAVHGAREELGQGVPMPQRLFDTLDGFLAAAARAQGKNNGEDPSPEQIARHWSITKKQAYPGRRELGRYTKEKGDDGKPIVVNQDSEQVPMGPWRVKDPTGEDRGDEYPGKVQLATEMLHYIAGDRVEDASWLDKTGKEALLPDHAAVTMPLGTALHLKDEVGYVLADLPTHHVQALTLRWGLDGQDPMDYADVAEALGLEPKDRKGGDTADRNRQLRYLGKKAVDEATAAFKVKASDDLGKLAGGWSRERERDNREPTKPIEGPSFHDALAKFGDDPMRARIYLAALHDGRGTDVESVLAADAKGEASPDAVKRVHDWYHAWRDNQRLQAFRQHGKTLAVDPKVARPFGEQTGTDPRSDALYADEVMRGYMRAVAKRGLPQYVEPDPGPATSDEAAERAGAAGGERSKVWTPERLDRFFGRSHRSTQQEGDNGGSG